VQVLDAARALADARMTYGRAAFMLAQNRVELRAAAGATDLGSPLSGAGR
jgi:outer membrane protein TolC